MVAWIGSREWVTARLQVDDLELNVRALNCLHNAGITSYDKLAAMTEEELLAIPRLGRKTCRLILAECWRVSSELAKLPTTMLNERSRVTPPHASVSPERMQEIVNRVEREKAR